MIDPELSRDASGSLAAVLAGLLEDAAPFAARLPAFGEAGAQQLLRSGEDILVLARAIVVLVRLAGGRS